ncbi:hypothetical protein BDY19DRAFT_999051, partial [Irpex rosettiformis]
MSTHTSETAAAIISRVGCRLGHIKERNISRIQSRTWLCELSNAINTLMSIPGMQDHPVLRSTLLSGATSIFRLREMLSEVTISELVMTLEKCRPLFDHYLQTYPQEVSRTTRTALQGLGLTEPVHSEEEKNVNDRKCMEIVAPGMTTGLAEDGKTASSDAQNLDTDMGSELNGAVVGEGLDELAVPDKSIELVIPSMGKESTEYRVATSSSALGMDIESGNDNAEESTCELDKEKEIVLLETLRVRPRGLSDAHMPSFKKPRLGSFSGEERGITKEELSVEDQQKTTVSSSPDHAPFESLKTSVESTLLGVIRESASSSHSSPAFTATGSGPREAQSSTLNQHVAQYMSPLPLSSATRVYVHIPPSSTPASTSS